MVNSLWYTIWLPGFGSLRTFTLLFLLTPSSPHLDRSLTILQHYLHNLEIHCNALSGESQIYIFIAPVLYHCPIIQAFYDLSCLSPSQPSSHTYFYILLMFMSGMHKYMSFQITESPLMLLQHLKVADSYSQVPTVVSHWTLMGQRGGSRITQIPQALSKVRLLTHSHSYIKQPLHIIWYL